MKKTLVLTMLLYYVESRKMNDKCSDFTTTDYNSVEQEIIKTDIGSPYQLAIDYDKNTLFFSYNREDSGKSTFVSAYINLITNEFVNIKGIVGGFANAVDQENHIVYLGGEKGVYTFNYESDSVKHINGTSNKVWQMFFKKELYYTKYPEEEIFILKRGQVQRLPQLNNTNGMMVAIDNNENIYFSNSSGLFIYEENMNSSSITFVGDSIINGFTSDLNGNLFFSTPNAIYRIDDTKKLVKQIVFIDDVYGIAVEHRGNIIYSTEDSIIRLKPKMTDC